MFPVFMCLIILDKAYFNFKKLYNRKMTVIALMLVLLQAVVILRATKVWGYQLQMNLLEPKLKRGKGNVSFVTHNM